MADITMCEGTNCPKKETCYRFTAKPDEDRQSYFMTPPNNGDSCDQFWDTAPKKVFTGIAYFDELLGGFRRGHAVMIAGHTGGSKSVLVDPPPASEGRPCKKVSRWRFL